VDEAGPPSGLSRRLRCGPSVADGEADRAGKSTRAA
jgi:hypothetical protein